MFYMKAKKEHNISKTRFECRRDNLTIRGTGYRPIGINLPIAIVCHGFMAFQSIVRQYAIELANMGYLTYTFDFCGGSVIMGKSDGLTTEMSVLTEVKDLERVIDYAINREYADKNNIVVMGCIQGGYVSALTVAKGKYNVNKLVLFYPAFCIPDDANAGKMMFAKFDPNNLPEIIRCGPMKLGKCYVEDVIKMNPFEEIKGYKNDVLIVHGAKDKIVDINYSKRAFDVYKNSISNRNVRFEIIENGRHGFSKKIDKIAIETLRDFIIS
ncbi:hypothetical protein SFBM_0681 [Candidatus Arthromitus sp. SFB-mouse-Japan]|uniref:alpha/beta hydrolase family protein n=1 Tax=unclassified Candidatus Neoarthromitus TaxID=2638829 RepID=UPI00021B8098|nr:MULTISPECIES: alpha/beta hydrolase [unclassified Candidatus Arthromitus]AID44630.1 Hypothetical protein SFBmNL_00722 [Candidatus Arthromitus sp. SFB-mouse-NL]BAK56455.1 hypothetical protein SFBM_0681 [Candidatus Arthromitus sp. SFB-mouse-Japan]BAK79782.1 hypothetical protein MOUSESFB_0640 [Candidatus Arthromitus sp. SFB-mouse-Yit]